MQRIGNQQGMTVIEHLSELRKRVVISVLAVIIGVVAAFIAKDWVFAVIKRPLDRMEGINADLVTFSPTEPFMTVLKVSIYAGLLVALPIVLWQAWAFIMPALYEGEKKAILPYVAFTTFLFLAGVVFGYFVVLPVGLGFLVGYGGEIFVQQLRAAEYISFVSLFLLGFGVVFEIPAVMLMVGSAGLVDAATMKRVRKYAFIVIAVLAMVITPSQDPVSMLLMMAPLAFLYELGIVLTRISDRRRRRRLARADKH